MKKRKNIYLGGGFQDSQVLWVTKIISGYEQNPENIIIEKNYKNVVMENLYKTFPKSNIIIEKNFFLKNKNILTMYIAIFFFLVSNINKIFFFLKKLEKRRNSFVNSYENQIVNSIWDTSLNLMNDNQLNPNFLQKCKAIFRTIIAVNRAKKLISNEKINTAFLGHSVYSSRAMLAFFRKKKIKIFCQASYNIYDSSYGETAWNQIPRKSFNIISKKVKKKYISRYWQNRLKGKSNYNDAKVAGSIKNKIFNYPKNVILLHIFKDSPFNYIDDKRIFYDYFDWIKKTLKIIEKSNEYWSLRIHPNASRWGENQKIIIDNLLKENPNIKKKILVDDSYVSNNFIFKTVKRLVTYSGTSHLEASCFKIKPIMISKSSLECLNSQFVLKPKNIKEYENYLLQNSNNKIFKQSNSVKNISKTMLFIRENILTLIKDLNGTSTYRKDNKKIINKEFNDVLKSIKSNTKYLMKLGQNLNKNYTHCFSKNYYLFKK